MKCSRSTLFLFAVFGAGLTAILTTASPGGAAASSTETRMLPTYYASDELASASRCERGVSDDISIRFGAGEVSDAGTPSPTVTDDASDEGIGEASDDGIGEASDNATDTSDDQGMDRDASSVDETAALGEDLQPTALDGDDADDDAQVGDDDAQAGDDDSYEEVANIEDAGDEAADIEGMDDDVADEAADEAADENDNDANSNDEQGDDGIDNEMNTDETPLDDGGDAMVDDGSDDTAADADAQPADGCPANDSAANEAVDEEELATDVADEGEILEDEVADDATEDEVADDATEDEVADDSDAGANLLPEGLQDTLTAVAQGVVQTLVSASHDLFSADWGVSMGQWLNGRLSNALGHSQLWRQ
jgi:hypothetical protein